MNVIIPPDHDPLKPFDPRTSLGEVVRCQNHDTFCVPGAISACTGFSTGQVAAAILAARETVRFRGRSEVRRVWSDATKSYTNRLMVGGVTGYETELALTKLGVKFVKVGWAEIKNFGAKIYKPRPSKKFPQLMTYPDVSLAALMDNLLPEWKGRPMLISLAGHMIAGQDDLLVDNRLGPYKREFFGSGRAKVDCFYIINP